MATINDLAKSKYLKQGDVDPPVLVTISGYKNQNVAKESESPDMKYCLFFKELEKPLVLNSTNGQLIAKITGSEDLDDWEGKKVVLYNDPNISFGGKICGGIRVRAPKAGAKGKAEPEPAPTLTDEDLDEIPF